MRAFLGFLVFVIAAGALAASQSLFVVDVKTQAVLVQLGEPVQVFNAHGKTEPGLRLKIPFIQNVVTFDKRNINFDIEPTEIIAASQQKLNVDAFARFRITDPLRFYRAVGDEVSLRSRLEPIMEASLRNVLGGVEPSDIISGRRGDLMVQIRNIANRQARGEAIGLDSATGQPENLGVEIIDVRIRRADLPKENAEKVFNRMETDRKQVAAKKRAEGEERARVIRAEADREVVVTLAKSREQAEIIKGEGDARRNEIYAAAYNKDRDFFDFYRTMLAYESSLDAGTTLLLSADGEFFSYFDGARRPSAPPR